jgi:hypothetical protein
MKIGKRLGDPTQKVTAANPLDDAVLESHPTRFCQEQKKLKHARKHVKD